MESTNIELLESQNQENNGTTFIRTCFNGLNALTGIGLLSIPYALSRGGWLSLITLFGIAIICFYTGLLMKKCMDTNPHTIKTYPDIGEQAFGKKGRLTISIFMYLELILLAVELLILEGDNLHKLFPNANILGVGGIKVFVIVTALIMLPTTWLRNLSFLAYMSVCGIFASIIIVATVFWIGAFENVGFSEEGDLWRFDGIPTAVSLYTFCYCAHPIFPTMYTSMRDKTQFSKVLLVSFVMSSFIYGSMAIFGYLMYGDRVMSQVTLNLPTNKISSKIAIYTTLINPIAKYAMIITPIVIALEEKLVLEKRMGMSLLIRSILVVSTAIIALVVPFFAYVMAFMGAFMGVSVSILFPCLCYLKIVEASRMEIIFILMILAFGCFVAVAGTFVSIRDIVQHTVHTM